MTSCSELSLTWNNALTEWLPAVITKLALEFLRVDHVVRIATREEFENPELDHVRRWLFMKSAPSDLFMTLLLGSGQVQDPKQILQAGKRVFDDNIVALSKGHFSHVSILTLLPRALVVRQDDVCREEIWREFERILLDFVSPLGAKTSFDEVAPFAKVHTFLRHLHARDRALAFDSETGACFSFDHGSLTNVHRLEDIDVLVATERAWQCRQDSFLLRDNVVAVVDLVDEDGTTRVAFDYPPWEHPQ